MKGAFQAVATATEQQQCPEHGPVRRFDFVGRPWLRFDEAAAYVGCRHRCGCPSAKGFYNWRIRRGVVVHGSLVAKADLDRLLRQKARA